ncbi:MAG: hypothetical protein ABSH22_05420 [Tepidisphaeraceae bacterium]|jgi:hypothetical protein
MKLTTLTVAAALSLGTIVAFTAGAEAASSHVGIIRVANIQGEMQILRADVASLKSAVQSHNKAAAVAAGRKLEADWSALPATAKGQILDNYPAVAKTVGEIKAVRADIEAIKAARKSKDKAAVEAARAKLKTDWEALPPGVRMLIEAIHPEVGKAAR